MSRPEVRDPWYRAIIKHPTLTNGTKLLLVVLVDDMRIDGKVSVPRTALARKLGIHERRITERLTEAVEVGVLQRVVSGKPGTTAEYAAVIPDGAPVRTKRRRQRSASYGAPVRTMQVGLDGAPVRTPDLVRALHQAEVHPCAPSSRSAHGADVGPAITTNSPFVSAPSVASEVLKNKSADNEKVNRRSDATGSSVLGNCAVCPNERKLGADGLCSECFAATFSRSTCA